MVLCGDLEEWDWVGKWEGGIYVHIELIHFTTQQKLTQHFKAIMLQLKKKKELTKLLFYKPEETAHGSPMLILMQGLKNISFSYHCYNEGVNTS